jgi:hypothetical protein
MPLFDKRKKKQEANAEEQQRMARAEAMVSDTNKPATEGYTFDEEAEKKRALEAKSNERANPLITVIQGAEPGKSNTQKQQTYEPNSAALQNILKADASVNSALSADTNASQTVLSGIQDAENLDEIEQIKTDADAAKKEVQMQQSNLFNAMAGALDTMSDDEKNKMFGNAQNQMAQQNVNQGMLGTLGEQKQKPSYTSTATTGDIQKGIDDSLANYGAKAPIATIEKLGVQDYYPQVGKDIAVGNFTGSRIGSQTIYSGAGALLPMGLYDARKRALAEAAKQRQKDLEKFLDIPDTAAQFNTEFGQYAGNIIQDIAKKNNYDPSLIGRDKEGQLELKRLETTAKDISYADSTIKDLFERSTAKDGSTAGYIPEGMKNEMYKFRSGLTDNMEDYFTGKKKIGELTNNLRVYADGTKMINEMLPKWTDESNQTQRPISLKSGLEITDKEYAKINEAIKGINEGSGDYDSHISMLKKYYSVNDSLVDDWCDLQGYSKDDLARKSLKEYMMAQIPEESFVQEVKSLANKNYDYWKTRGEWAREDEKNKTYFTLLVEEADKQNVPVKANGVIQSWNANPNKSQADKQKDLASLYAGFSTPTVSTMNNKYAYGKIKVDPKAASDRPVSVTASNGEIKLKKTDGGFEYVNLGLAAKKLNKNGTIYVNGVSYKVPENSDDYKTILEVKKSGAVPGIDYEKHVQAAYKKNGVPYEVTTDNLNTYTNAQDKTWIGTSLSNTAFPEEVVTGYDESGKPIKETKWNKSTSEIRYRADLNTMEGRDIMDFTQGARQQSVSGGEAKDSPIK